MGKFLNDVFSMSFDIIIPLSSCIVAVVLGALLFSIRYFSYIKNKRRYEKRIRKQGGIVTTVAGTNIAPGGTISG